MESEAEDFHDTQVSELGREEEDGDEKVEPVYESVAVSDVFGYGWDDIKSVVMPKIKTHYIQLDSNNRLGAPKNDVDNRLEWIINYGLPIWEKGYINVPAPIRNIVAVEMGCVSFNDRRVVADAGYESVANSLLPISNEADWINNQRISLLIEELSTQAYIAAAGNKYHFIAKRKEIPDNELPTSFTSYNRGFPTFITYPFNKGRYSFYKPIMQLDRITLRLFGPDKPIVMDKEIYYTADVLYDNGDFMDPDRYSVILVFGEDVYINYNEIEVSGFTTDDPVTDAATILAVNTRFKAVSLYPNSVRNYKRILPVRRYQLNVSSVGITPAVVAPTVRIVVRYNFNACLRVDELVDEMRS